MKIVKVVYIICYKKPKDSSNGEYCLNIQKLVHTCGKCDKLDSN